MDTYAKNRQKRYETKFVDSKISITNNISIISKDTERFMVDCNELMYVLKRLN